MRVMKRIPLVILVLSGVLLGGCKTDTKMAPNEEANFKGGPMPADFLSKHKVSAGPSAATTAPAKK